MPSELRDRVRDLLNVDPSSRVMSPTGQHGWNPAAGPPQFGQVLPAQDVKAIIVHGTQGWPTRNKADATFVRRYTVQQFGESDTDEVHPCANCHGVEVAGAGCKCKWGIGPMYYISYDGTIARLISSVEDEARVTFHAESLNDRSIGVETGNLFTTGAPPGSGWVRLSRTPADDDVPGANLFVRDHRDNPREVIACWWTTNTYAGPQREHVGARSMLYSEAEYRAWALLGRFLAEQFEVPRNLPLLPFEDPGSANAADNYRRIVLADPAFDAITADLPAGFNMPPASFANNPAAIQAAYNHLGAGTANQAVRRLFRTYRGFCGHKFALGHECPGPVFDWWRFARELWDWWWYPFDVVDIPPTTNQTTAAPRREYAQPSRSTTLIEHYFDDDNQSVFLGALDGRHAARLRDGIQGNTSAPATWRLDAGSPVYALANGELVAARFAQPKTDVSLSFILVRHLVFHRTVGGADPVQSLRLDYDQPATTVYSLYMHLGHPTGLDLTAVNAANPDWLNRVHIRKKECDLGMTFYGDETHHGGIDTDAWTQPLPPLLPLPPPLPAQPLRPTLVDGWRIDQAALTTFLADLQAGNVAMAPFTFQSTPIRIILGDYLGNDGVITSAQGAQTRGIRVEVFSPTQLPGFTLAGAGTGWGPLPQGFVGPPVQQFPSEWARTLSDADKAALTALGVDVDLVMWWPAVAAAMTTDQRIDATDRLPADGRVFHYQPFDFLRWINGITWSSEWPKYQMHDADGNDQPAPAVPRSRRR